MEPLYTTRPGGTRLFEVILYGLVALGLVLGLVMLLLVDATSALITVASILATLALVWLILPRRYEVWPESLRLVFPFWRWDIRYESIRLVREAAALESYAFIGVRFATAPSQAVTILRHNANLIGRPNVVVSPEDRDEFMRHLQRAMRR